ncbi:NUDIX domain-containing protein [Candidatus Binatia bacterium]|nr:NUDIX domain-containing protein [Candidatus Binatia bacterium]
MRADELVDVLGEDGGVVGQATRSQVRRQGLLHQSVYVLVFNSRGQLFVHERTPTKDVYPGCWDVAVGGVVGAGEDTAAGARRELFEELGVRTALRQLFSFRFEEDGNRVIGAVFSCTWDGPVKLQAEEIVRGEWLDLEAVVERSRRDSFCPDSLEALGMYLAKLEAAMDRR